MIDYKKFVEGSRNWLRNYILDNRLESVCVGVSGGIDSTCSIAIASPVCKQLNIPLIGRSLPTSTNKSDEITVADLVGKAFCTDYKKVSINCDDIISEFEFCENKMSALQKGNIKARYRMMYLYNTASIYRGIVLDNDNFTEYNVGFFTIHGDQGDVNLGLHHLWKTEIYELADYLMNECLKDNPEGSRAIACSYNLIPTDGNGVSNSDCDQFGLENYKQVDDVLRTMYFRTPVNSITNDLDPEYIRLIDSYNEQGVDKVMLLHQNTEYKRKPSPIMPSRKELGL